MWLNKEFIPIIHHIRFISRPPPPKKKKLRFFKNSSCDFVQFGLKMIARCYSNKNRKKPRGTRPFGLRSTEAYRGSEMKSGRKSYFPSASHAFKDSRQTPSLETQCTTFSNRKNTCRLICTKKKQHILVPRDSTI